MKRNISIQIKAAFLLVVFALNTVVGFACAVGVDMGFNTHHHDEEEATETTVHVHTDGKKHQHHEEVVKHHDDSKEDSEKGGCCNDGVMKFQNLDKSLASNANIFINAPVFVAVLSSFFGIDIFRQPQVPHEKFIAQFLHPPPPDILIAIQRFQI
ncbi:MAG: hypothetical protein ABIR78_09880 [Ferruginibacter sp.]